MDIRSYNHCDVSKPKGWNRGNPNLANIGSFSSSWISPTTMKQLKVSINSIVLKMKCPCCPSVLRLQSSIVVHNEVEAIHLSYVCANCKEEFTTGEIDAINLAQFNPSKKKQIVINLIQEIFTKNKNKQNG